MMLCWFEGTHFHAGDPEFSAGEVEEVISIILKMFVETAVKMGPGTAETDR